MLFFSNKSILYDPRTRAGGAKPAHNVPTPLLAESDFPERLLDRFNPYANKNT
jgi:hypothetical protein